MHLLPPLIPATLASRWIDAGDNLVVADECPHRETSGALHRTTLRGKRESKAGHGVNGTPRFLISAFEWQSCVWLVRPADSKPEPEMPSANRYAVNPRHESRRDLSAHMAIGAGHPRNRPRRLIENPAQGEGRLKYSSKVDRPRLKSGRKLAPTRAKPVLRRSKRPAGQAPDLNVGSCPAEQWRRRRSCETDQGALIGVLSQEIRRWRKQVSSKPEP